MKTVAVVGGGFAGAYFLKEFQRVRKRAKSPLKAVLYEPNEHFVFTPLLPEVATGTMTIDQVRVGIDRLYKGDWFTHVRERVECIDTKQRRIITKQGSRGYDYLIIATGSRTNYFGNERLARRTLTLKTGRDALQILAALSEMKTGETLTIVGGGPTGVELAAEAKQYLDRQRLQATVRLLQRSPVLLPMAAPRVQQKASERLRELGVDVRTGICVEGVDGTGTRCTLEGNALLLDSTITIWVAGVTPNNPQKPGPVPIDTTFLVVGEERLFAIGDVAQFDPEYSQERLPALAQVAVQAGPHAARNLIRLVNGEELQPFTYRSKGFLVSLGHYDAAAELYTPFGTLFLTGFFAWWLWRTIYLMKFLDAKQQAQNVITWTKDLFR